MTTTAQDTQRAAVYVRISRDDEGLREGVERQREDCLKRVEREGWMLTDIYEDNSVSAAGSKRKARPDYDRMLADARARRFDVILAYSNSRLTRRHAELAELIELHKETGITIKTIVSGDDDLSTADGRMVAWIKASVDAAEAERTSERRKRQNAADRAAGKYRGGRRSFGWNTDGTPHPKEHPALRAALQAILAGYSVYSIAKRWNDRGLLTSAGKPWESTALKLTLMRWRNAALVEYGGKPAGPGKWKAACTEDELRRVRSILTAPARRTSAGRESTTLLASIARCGKCGSPMVSGGQLNRNGTKASVYRCRGAQAHRSKRCFVTILSDTLDAAVIERTKTALYFGKHRGLTPSADDRQRLAELHGQRAEIDTEETETGDLIGQGLLRGAAARGALEGIRERRQQIETELDTIQSRYALSSLLGAPVVTTNDQGQHVASFDRATEIARDWKALPLPRRREIVRALFDVVVNPGRDPEERIKITPR